MKIRRFVSRFVLFAVVIAGGLFLFAVWDAIGNAKYHARNVACKSNLKRIGQQIATYRKAHNGQMPDDLTQLQPSCKHSAICTITGYELKANGRLTYYTYAYRRLKAPNATDIISWDRKVHVPQHIFGNAPCRNVLTANGTVKTLDEKDFISLGLTGSVNELDAYTNEWIRNN
jgi:hypothetical protein